MLTDQQARDLLHLAADTVTVGNAPVPVPTPPRVWPLVAVAASVILVVGGVSVLARSGDDKPDPAPPPTSTDDGQFRLGSDQVPSVFGYSAEDAVVMLEERGLAASITPYNNECGETPGRATSVDPPPGTIVEPGDTVEVRSPSGLAGGGGFCVLDTYRRAEAWSLIDYANGRGEAPATAPGVDLDLGPVAERLRAWSAAVGRYEQGREGQNRLRWPTPRLTTSPAAEFACVGLPDRLVGREVLALTVALEAQPSDGVGPSGQCHTVLVAYTDDGTIADVAVPKDFLSDDPLVPADVVGNTVAFATARLTAQGVKVEPVARADCQPIGVITAQQPYPSQNVKPGTTVHVAYTSETGPCIKNSLEIQTPARSAAESFIAFARGGPLPPLADTVDVYAGNVLRSQLSAAEAADRASWTTACPAIRDSLCQASVIDRIQSGPGPAVTQPFVRENDPCHFVDDNLPAELTTPDALSRSASFGLGEPRTCADNWEAQIWIDDEGRIHAVNLILGNPLAID